MSPTLKSYFFGRAAVERDLVGGLRRARRSRSRGPGRSSRRDSRRSSVGGPLETIALPCLSSSVPSELTLPSATVDARRRLDLSSVSAGIVGGAEKSALTAWLGLDRDVDALLRALEEVLERGVDRVGEDQRADHEGDADDDREAGQDRPQLARNRPLSASFCVTPRPSSGRARPRRRCRRRRGRPRRRAAPRSGRRPRPPAASWVTMITVCSNSSTAWRSRPSTSSEECESRLPVGSSANSTAGRCTSARATATRCCWPPESSDGRCVSRSRRPTVSISLSNQALVGLAAGERQRQHDVLLGGQHRHEVEGLEDEARAGRAAAA